MSRLIAQALRTARTSFPVPRVVTPRLACSRHTTPPTRSRSLLDRRPLPSPLILPSFLGARSLATSSLSRGKVPHTPLFPPPYKIVPGGKWALESEEIGRKIIRKVSRRRVIYRASLTSSCAQKRASPASPPPLSLASAPATPPSSSSPPNDLPPPSFSAPNVGLASSSSWVQSQFNAHPLARLHHHADNVERLQLLRWRITDLLRQLEVPPAPVIPRPQARLKNTIRWQSDHGGLAFYDTLAGTALVGHAQGPSSRDLRAVVASTRRAEREWKKILREATKQGITPRQGGGNEGPAPPASPSRPTPPTGQAAGGGGGLSSTGSGHGAPSHHGASIYLPWDASSARRASPPAPRKRPSLAFLSAHEWARIEAVVDRT